MLAVPALLLVAFVLPASAGAAFRATQIAGGFDAPVAVTAPPGDVHRIFVVERQGAIHIVRDGVRLPTRFLDLTGGQVRHGGEQGMLSLAFAPDYAASGRFYVWYTAPRPGDNEGSILTLDEFTRSSDPELADPATRRNVLTIDHPLAGNHNGGQLMFGPDGFLYVTTGDGGGGNDLPNNAQNLNSLLGKALRIDPRGGAPYAIPPGNPFASPTDGARDEIWAYGLRNPFRASFDRQTGDLTIADVGQNRAEEVNFSPRGTDIGANYGWRCYEGFQRTTNPCDPSSLANHTEPVLEQDRTTGFCAIIGGYVVRDPALSDAIGRYVYGDNCQPQLRSAVLAKPRASDDKPLGVSINQLSSFGEDTCGHVYMTSLAGPVYRLDGDAAPMPCPEEGGPTGPGGPGGSDTAAPGLALSWRRAQRALRQKGFIVAVTCNEDCGFTVSGRMRISRSKRVYVLKPSSKLAAAGRRVRVRLAMSKKATRALRRALARRRRSVVTVTVEARDAAGNVATRKLRIRARR
jgi:glucose/arabinose dehydrogenase